MVWTLREGAVEAPGVLVTGAGKGIGQATALAFAARGNRVAVVSRSAEAAEETLRRVRAAGAEGIAVAVDVGTPDGAQRAVRATVDAFGRLDVLVNNAGVYRQGDLLETDLALWEEVLRVNLTGPFLCAKHAAAVMARQGGGVIVNVASEAGLVAIPRQLAYNVSKAGLVMFTKSLAVDLAARGIRVNCVCPGTTDTPLVQEAVRRAADPEAARRRLETIRPLGRLGRAEEIAEAIVFLASESCGYATGAVLAVDGGYTAQ